MGCTIRIHGLSFSLELSVSMGTGWPMGLETRPDAVPGTASCVLRQPLQE